MSKTLSRIALFALIVSAVSPFLNPSNSYEWAFEPRFSALMLAAALAAFGVLREDKPFALPRLADKVLAGSLAAFSVAVLVSAGLSALPAESFTFGAERSLRGAPTWLALALITWSVSRMRIGKAETLAVLVPLTALGALTAGGALSEVAAGRPVVAGFGNAEYAGVALLMALPAAVLLVRLAASPLARALAFGAVATILVAAIGTGSAAVIGVLVMAVVALLLGGGALLGGGEARQAAGRKTGVAIAGLMLVVVTLSLAVPVPVTSDFVRDAVSGPTVVTRTEMWGQALKVFEAHPLLGTGPDGYMLASQPFLSVRQMAMEGGGGSGTGLLNRDPHMLPLTLLASFGVVGAIAALACFFAWAWTFVIALRDHPRSRPVRVAFGIAALSFLACMLVVPWVVEFAALPALLAGLAIAPFGERRPEPETRPAKAAKGRKAAAAKHAAPVSGPAPIALAGVAVVAVAALYLSYAALQGQYEYTRFLAAPEAEQQDAAISAAIALQPQRTYLRYQHLQALGTRLQDGIITPAEYRSAVDRFGPVLRVNAVYAVNLARPALDTAQTSGDKALLGWAVPLVRSAEKLAPDHPDVALEAAHAAILGDRFEFARARLGFVESVGTSGPRVVLYRYLLAKRTADPSAAARLLAVQADPSIARLAVDKLR